MMLVQGALDHLIQRHPFMRLAQPAFGQAGQLLALPDDQVRLFQRLFQFARFPSQQTVAFAQGLNDPAQRMQGHGQLGANDAGDAEIRSRCARTCGLRRLASCREWVCAKRAHARRITHGRSRSIRGRAYFNFEG
jgi:hypothetical protein